MAIFKGNMLKIFSFFLVLATLLLFSTPAFASPQPTSLALANSLTERASDACEMAWSAQPCSTPPDWRVNKTVHLNKNLGTCIHQCSGCWFFSFTLGENCFKTDATNLTIFGWEGCPDNAKRVYPTLPPDDAANLVNTDPNNIGVQPNDGNVSDARYSTKFTIPLNKWPKGRCFDYWAKPITFPDGTWESWMFE